MGREADIVEDDWLVEQGNQGSKMTYLNHAYQWTVQPSVR